jgi:hypothetical protein
MQAPIVHSPAPTVSVVPEDAILPLDRPGDDPVSEARLDEILDYLAEPIEEDPIEVEAETIE